MQDIQGEIECALHGNTLQFRNLTSHPLAILLYFISRTGDETQGLTDIRQALHHRTTFPGLKSAFTNKHFDSFQSHKPVLLIGQHFHCVHWLRGGDRGRRKGGT